MCFFEAIVKRINTLMVEFEFTMEILQEKSKLSKDYLNDILSNKKNDLLALDLSKIISAFNISLSEFFNDKIFLWKNLDLLQ